ncbi:hypothetical protein [Phytohabitans kaempferiae]|uniref:Uncharacterized protein n=1 Tax=Phytohabitans kaempferiae TaxID=1620943 RepID=A0ABV6LV21_9ACTN
MAEPRSAGAMGTEFPYELGTMCYIEVAAGGAVSQGADRAACQRALAGQSRLFAVWPGNYRSDLFAIDDLDQYARGMGWVHDEARTGLVDHEHQVRWQVDEFERNPNGTYISVEVRLDCGCTIRDLRAFAEQMRQQRGWDVATSGGYSGVGPRFTVRARRRSLGPQA